MKILFISSANSTYGISPIIKNQGEAIMEKGISLSYFPIKGRGFIGYFRNIILLRKYLSTHYFDILHAHYGLSAIVCLLARRGHKLVVSFMGDDLLGSNRSNGSLTVKSRMHVFINIFCATYFYDYSIVKSEEMYNKLKITNKSLIPNGIDLDKFYYIRQSKAKEYVTNFGEEKNVIFVADPSRVEKNFILAEKSVNYIVSNKVNLIPLSSIDHNLLVYYYNASDALALSSYHEGSPNVIKEAMACNCPIVATNVGDVKWVLGKTPGCFISSFAYKDFAEKIRFAIDFREKSVQTKGRDRILELGLDSVVVANRIKEVYRKVIN